MFCNDAREIEAWNQACCCLLLAVCCPFNIIWWGFIQCRILTYDPWAGCISNCGTAQEGEMQMVSGHSSFTSGQGFARCKPTLRVMDSVLEFQTRQVGFWHGTKTRGRSRLKQWHCRFGTRARFETQSLQQARTATWLVSNHTRYLSRTPQTKSIEKIYMLPTLLVNIF